MTRDEYILAVKAKLEEISPFDGADDNFIAAGSDKRVKPIQSYIESELDNAARFCLNTLPLSLLSEDIESDSKSVRVDKKGVGHVSDQYEYVRYVRISCDLLDRDILSVISTSSPMYTLQLNKYTRGGYAKPVAAYNPEEHELEIFSFSGNENTGQKADISYIDTSIKAELVQSRIEEYIILRTAMCVARILGDVNTSTIFEKEWTELAAPILK